MGEPAQRWTNRARILRARSTDAERKLWSMLRGRGVAGHKFVRQLPIGPYVVDFACREAGLVVEVDGSQHAESRRDDDRTGYLNSEGYAVLRFWNTEVLQYPEGTFLAIEAILAGHPSPGWRFSPADLSPEGRGVRGATASANSSLRKHRVVHCATSPLPSGERSPRSGG